MNTQFDSDFRQIPLLALHPTYLPYVGDEYDQYRVLHIGESHYLNQSPDSEKYGIHYFEKWWSEACDDVLNDSYGWADTRQVIERYINDVDSSAYTIFTNFIKSFSKVVLNQPISSITAEGKKLYKYICFMNFFQMPSLYNGTKFWDSLEISASLSGDISYAYDFWKRAVDQSIDVIDNVIEVIKPRAIVFTSISAGNAYKENNGKFRNSEKVIYTSHPGYPFTWWKDLKSLDYKKGIDVFEAGLERIYK